MTALTTHAPIAGIAEWTAFLSPLVASVRNPPERDRYRATCAAMVHAFPDVPASLLAKPWLQSEAMRKFAFWPAVADMHELLAPELVEARRDAARYAIAAPMPEGRTPPTQAEVAAVRAKLAAFKASAPGAHGATAPERKVKPCFANPHQLLAGYEKLAAEGNPAAELRARKLREALGAEQDA